MADSDVDDSALDEEWADLAEGDDEDGASNPDLNQDEIDSLLGFGNGDDAEPTGIAAIIWKAGFDNSLTEFF